MNFETKIENSLPRYNSSNNSDVGEILHYCLKLQLQSSTQISKCLVATIKLHKNEFHFNATCSTNVPHKIISSMKSCMSQY